MKLKKAVRMAFSMARQKAIRINADLLTQHVAFFFAKHRSLRYPIRRTSVRGWVTLYDLYYNPDQEEREEQACVASE